MSSLIFLVLTSSLRGAFFDLWLGFFSLQQRSICLTRVSSNSKPLLHVGQMNIVFFWIKPFKVFQIFLSVFLSLVAEARFELATPSLWDSWANRCSTPQWYQRWELNPRPCPYERRALNQLSHSGIDGTIKQTNPCSVWMPTHVL